MRTLARWCFQHRWIVLVGWLVALIGLSAIHGAAGSGYKDEFKLSGTDSFDALNLLQKSAPKASGDQEQLVVAVKDGKLTDPQIKARVETALNAVGRCRTSRRSHRPLTPATRPRSPRTAGSPSRR